MQCTDKIYIFVQLIADPQNYNDCYNMCWVCRYLPDEDIIISRMVEGLEDPVFNTFIESLLVFQY